LWTAGFGSASPVSAQVDRVRTAEQVLQHASPEHREGIQRQFDGHQAVLTGLQARLDPMTERRGVLETKFEDQQAYVAQSELIAFMTSTRKNARTPFTLAAAMAGLPEMSASYSYQRCGKYANAQRENASYQIFLLIGECCAGSAGPRSPNAVLDCTKITNAVAQQRRRTTHPIHHGYRYLARHWGYLRQAVEPTDLTDPQAPHDIYRRFRENMARPHSLEESALLESEQLNID
jgi:hypothetical protein